MGTPKTSGDSQSVVKSTHHLDVSGLGGHYVGPE